MKTGSRNQYDMVSPDRFNQRCDSVGYVFLMGKVIVTDVLGALPDPLFMPLPQSQLLIAALSSQLSYTSKQSLAKSSSVCPKERSASSPNHSQWLTTTGRLICCAQSENSSGRIKYSLRITLSPEPCSVPPSVPSHFPPPVLWSNTLRNQMKKILMLGHGSRKLKLRQ